MHPDLIKSPDDATKVNTVDKTSSAGKSLKRIFHQDESLKKIQPQPASFSLLMNPVRLSIFLHLFRYPCDHTRSISRNVGFSLGAVDWHLKKMIQSGYLKTAILNGKKMYWPIELVKTADTPLIQTFRNDWSIRILKIVACCDNSPKQSEIVEQMHEKQQNVDIWLAKMVSTGLLVKNSRGMGARYRANPEIAVRIREYDETAKNTAKFIIQLLRNDGLMPAKYRLRGSRLSVTVMLPTGHRRLNIECNPLAILKKYF